MKVTEIAFSSYAVTDIPRARAFYEGVLGLTVTAEADLGEEGHWIEYDIGPGTLSIGKMSGWLPSQDGCTVALEVEDLDEAMATIKASETPIKMGPIPTPGCDMVLIQDPDLNTIIIHKRKPGHL